MQLSDTDEMLEGLGPVPQDVGAFVERYAGKPQLSLQDADDLLATLGVEVPPAAHRPQSPPPNVYAAYLVDSIPSPAVSGRTSGPAASRDPSNRPPSAASDRPADDTIPPPVPTFRNSAPARHDDYDDTIPPPTPSFRNSAPARHGRSIPPPSAASHDDVTAVTPGAGVGFDAVHDTEEVPIPSAARERMSPFDLDSELPPALVAGSGRRSSRPPRQGLPPAKPAKFAHGLPGVDDLPDVTPMRQAAKPARDESHDSDEDDFEILVDEEILEIEPDDLIDDSDDG